MKAMESPFTGGVPAVFIHVSDLKKSVEWYSNLLGKESPENVRDDIHIFELDSGANIFLRYTEQPKPTTQVLCSLPASDLKKARNFFEINHIEIVDMDEETIRFKDLNGNVIMACSI